MVRPSIIVVLVAVLVLEAVVALPIIVKGEKLATNAGNLL
jgi:hypothetical protein